ncbi:MAG: exonuclease [Phycisphaerales bacterium]|nr:exonuclease [Phycisphaerales bacterium]
MPEIYISTDVETDGPIPGVNSILSFASAAFLADKTQVGSFSANLHTLQGASPDPRTAEWWKSQPEAWAASRTNLEQPQDAMRRYVEWIAGLGGSPVFVGYPVAFDFLFVYWYLIRFTGASPFSHSALDIKTYAMAMLGDEYRKSVKRNMPRRWFDDHPHTHVALDDAIGQGLLFCNMLAENQARITQVKGKDSHRPGTVPRSP